MVVCVFCVPAHGVDVRKLPLLFLRLRLPGCASHALAPSLGPAALRRAVSVPLKAAVLDQLVVVLGPDTAGKSAFVQSGGLQAAQELGEAEGSPFAAAAARVTALFPRELANRYSPAYNRALLERLAAGEVPAPPPAPAAPAVKAPPPAPAAPPPAPPPAPAPAPPPAPAAPAKNRHQPSEGAASPAAAPAAASAPQSKHQRHQPSADAAPPASPPAPALGASTPRQRPPPSDHPAPPARAASSPPAHTGAGPVLSHPLPPAGAAAGQEAGGDAGAGAGGVTRVSMKLSAAALQEAAEAAGPAGGEGAAAEEL